MIVDIKMLIRTIILCASILVATSYGADHNTFKNCSRVSFCNELRNSAPDPEHQYRPDFKTVRHTDGIYFITLTNGALPDENNKIIQLKLSLLENDIFRIEIQEENSTRYKLQDVLDGEPKLKRIGFTEIFYSDDGNNRMVFQEHISSKARVDIYQTRFSFKLVVYQQTGVAAAVIEGDTIVLRNETDSQAFALKVKFPNALQLYGLHEHADVLALRNTSSRAQDPYRLRNLDVAGYELDSPMSLYGAIPVLYANGDSYTSGIFLHNAAEQWIDIGIGEKESSAYFMVESGALDLFVFPGSTVKDVVRQYTSLTGVAHMPQLWALGYHQCRWNYETQEDVKDVIANFDKHDFPLDAIWLDIEYTDGKKYFTWNPENFSDPLEMQRNISSTNRKLVTIIDPHIKVDNNYPVYMGAKEKNLFVQNNNGSVFEGICWPGLSSYMDFLNPEARTYYADQYSYENFINSTETLAGIWNDMNEPSVFDDSIEKTFPGSSLHTGGVLHRDIHNIYGLLQTKSTHEGLMKRDQEQKRPFILTRSHFAGSQRYAAIWTGDNQADWGYLAISYPECLNANLLGIVFCGADVGGFDGNPDVELLQRWYQAGAWLPFYRAHANWGTERREPYLFSEDVQDVIRDALKLRYAHLPVWYTLFYEHTRFGDPVIRPLFYHYSSDRAVLGIDDQLLVGSDIMVKAISKPGVNSTNVYFPGENESWLDINNNIAYNGSKYEEINIDIHSIPVYYRVGSIIPKLDGHAKSSVDIQNDCFTLEATLNDKGIAKGNLYKDDFTSFKYLNQAEYAYLEIIYDFNLKKIHVRNIGESNTSNSEVKFCKLIVNEFDKIKNGKRLYKTEIYILTEDGTSLSEKSLDFNINNVNTIKLK